MAPLAHKDTKAIAERLKLARTQRNFGVRELAREIDVAPGTVSWLEGGRANHVGVEIVAKLADALDVPREWLAWGKGDPFPGVKEGQAKNASKIK